MADIFTTAGEGLVADAVEAFASYFIGWGTGAGTSAKGDTTLFAESTESRVAAAMTQPTASTNQFLATITADAAKTITNAGVFTAASGGTLVTKSDFSGVALASGDKIEFTFQLAYS